MLLPFAAAAPTWRLAGPTLAYAAPAPDAHVAGALYRDTLWGSFDTRERYHNASGRPVTLGVALDNPAPFAVAVRDWAVGAWRSPAPVLLPAHGHRAWAVPVAVGRTAELSAGGRAGVAGLGPLDGLAAPLVVTLFAARTLPADPLALPTARRAGGARATFAHAQADLVLGASTAGPRSVAPASAVWPHLPAVDAVDGRTVWAAAPDELAPFLDVRLPAVAPGTRWHVIVARAGRRRVIATYMAAPFARRRLLPLPADALRRGSLVTLAPVRTPPRRPPARGRCGPPRCGWAASPRGA